MAGVVNHVSLLQILASVRLSIMRLVSIRQEAHYRGYRIEGAQQGQGMLLRVIPTRPYLPVLRYAHFRTLRSTWVKAVDVVVGYIDEAFIEIAHECPPKARGGFVTVPTNEPTDKAQLDEILRLRANEDSWRRAGPFDSSNLGEGSELGQPPRRAWGSRATRKMAENSRPPSRLSDWWLRGSSLPRAL